SDGKGDCQSGFRLHVARTRAIVVTCGIYSTCYESRTRVRHGMSELSHQDGDVSAPLPEDVPVEMPTLPLTLTLTTAQQFKAFGDPVRVRILGIIQQQPATAKQIAGQLGIPPGTIGHHLQVLERAGLAQVVARRLVRGIVAKYYTRTARLFNFDSGDQ